MLLTNINFQKDLYTDFCMTMQIQIDNENTKLEKILAFSEFSLVFAFRYNKVVFKLFPSLVGVFIPGSRSEFGII